MAIVRFQHCNGWVCTLMACRPWPGLFNLSSTVPKASRDGWEEIDCWSAARRSHDTASALAARHAPPAQTTEDGNGRMVVLTARRPDLTGHDVRAFGRRANRLPVGLMRRPAA